ncbi:MAG: malonic semialdehyde reductase [Hyphomonadaceae bacterium]
MKTELGDAVLDQLFREARTFSHWSDGGLSEADMKALFELTKMGPTAGNCSPARFVFVASQAGKERLAPHLSRGNLDQTMTAPVCVIVGYDLDFAERLPFLFPYVKDAASWYKDPEVQKETAFRSSSLQGAYLIMAARAMGFDCGPMSGFDNAGVDNAFFAGTRIRSNFLCNIGRGDMTKVRPRLPRLSFEDVCTIA